MFEFIFRVKNPRPRHREQKDYVVWDRKLSKNWAAELQITRWGMNNLVELWIDTAWTGEDHAGPRLHVELFGFMIGFKIYNVNHWDYEKNTWEVYDPNKKKEYDEY